MSSVLENLHSYVPDRETGIVPQFLSARSFIGPARSRAQTTVHIPALDGLRGIAAFIVLMFHAAQIIWPDCILPHAYLAVDFFFLLSGYMVAHAYEEKLKTSMSVWRFAAIRLARFYPMVFAGAVFGVLYFGLKQILKAPFEASDILTSFAAALTFMPSMALYATQKQLYPLNPPEWTLFYELAVNFIYASFAHRLTAARLAAVCVVSAVALIYVAVKNHGLDVGTLKDSFGAAFVRTLFPFSVGLLLHRFKPVWRMDGPLSLIPFFLLVAILCMPLDNRSAAYALVAVGLIFPSIILYASLCKLSPTLDRICTVLGTLSYPLYAVHYPILTIIARLAAHIDVSATPILAGFGCLSSIAVATFLYKFWDKPIRQRINRARWMREGFKPPINYFLLFPKNDNKT